VNDARLEGGHRDINDVNEAVSDWKGAVGDRGYDDA
jgi:hypothetical protein